MIIRLVTTDIKQAELVMQASLELLPLIMNNIPQAVFWKDRDLVYLGCNQAFADDAGFSFPGRCRWQNRSRDAVDGSG